MTTTTMLLLLLPLGGLLVRVATAINQEAEKKKKLVKKSQTRHGQGTDLINTFFSRSFKIVCPSIPNNSIRLSPYQRFFGVHEIPAN